MRRHDRALSAESVRELILRHNQAAVAMIDKDRPYIVMLNYAPDFSTGKVRFYFHSAREGRKIDCLRTHPRVSLFIHAPEQTRVISGKSCSQWTTAYASVYAEGTVHFLSGTEKCEAAALFMRHYTHETVPAADALFERTEIFYIEAEMISGKANIQG